MVEEAAKEARPALKLFIPCFMDQCTHQEAAAAVQLLQHLGVPWEYPAAQTCCGQFSLSLWFSQRA